MTMAIEVVMRESEDDFEVFSVAGTLGPMGSKKLMHDLDALLDNGGSNQQILLGIAGHLLYTYPGNHWTIKVERWDGYVYWLRFDGPRNGSRSEVPETVIRTSISKGTGDLAMPDDNRQLKLLGTLVGHRDRKSSHSSGLKNVHAVIGIRPLRSVLASRTRIRAIPGISTRSLRDSSCAVRSD